MVHCLRLQHRQTSLLIGTCRDTTSGNCMKGLAVSEMKQRTAKMCVIQIRLWAAVLHRKKSALACSFSTDYIAALNSLMCVTNFQICVMINNAQSLTNIKKSLNDNAESP